MTISWGGAENLVPDGFPALWMPRWQSWSGRSCEMFWRDTTERLPEKEPISTPGTN